MAMVLSAAVAGIGYTSSGLTQQVTNLKSGNKVAYVSGGVGLEQRAQLAQNEKESNLKLVFTEPQGSYLSGIGVTVADRSGNVLIDTTTQGPWLLARLDPGSYQVKVTDSQGSQVRAVNLGKDLRTVHFRLTAQAGIPGRPGS